MPSTNTCKLGNWVTILLYRYRASSSSSGHSTSYPGLKHAVQMCRQGEDSSILQQKQRFSGYSSVLFTNREIDMLKRESNKVEVQSAAPAPPRQNIYAWLKWFVGSIFSLLLPFLKQKWDNILLLEGKLEKAAEEVEYVAEVVEKVAITTEKVSEEVANNLPGNASDAQLAENIIHKANDLKEDVEELEKMVKPVVDRIGHVKHVD
ncbi:Chemoreceptor [Heracleum sosnowskyi]|uniref:Chemoreceptor n=1 Tax=Heracleum sosnowskyi TaxID=360622 RepID=A0AAD8H409_9APIA|nr:Chemoreceptor [Heracleum sosnowskyi]